MEIFLELALIIFVATVVSMIMRALKQPTIVGYILTGIIIGPYFLNILHVGLHMSPKVVKEVGKVSLFAGIGQILLTSSVGFIIATLLGIERVGAMYIGIAVTFSSTIIILKLLSDKGDLHKLYGKIAIGLLLVQDVIATIILIFTAATGNSVQSDLITVLSDVLLKTSFIAVLLYLSSTIMLPAVTQFLAKTPETLFLFSIGWGMMLASLFYVLGFSIEVGALIAGVTLASTPYVHEISSRLRPLRDFFVVLFFILLGSQMVFNNLSEILLPAVVLSLFMLIGNPIIVIIMMGLLGYNKRTSFLTGITITQMSEFSLILATLAFNVGQISPEVLSLITLVGLITIVFSTYIILHAHKLYPVLSDYLDTFEFRKHKYYGMADEKPPDAILFGYHRVGQDFVKSFQKLEFDFVVVDLNPESIKLLQSQNIPHRYGDAEDAEFLHELHINRVKMVVSTIPDFTTNLFLVHKIRSVNPHAVIITISHNAHEAKQLYGKGATYVVVPHYLGAQYASRMIASHGLDKKEFDEEREKHIEYLDKRSM
jgi:Kef-type K+ transport system membrane component KefB